MNKDSKHIPIMKKYVIHSVIFLSDDHSILQ